MSKEISLNNGTTWMTADEAMPVIDDRDLWDAVAEFMDDETRERVHAELAPCTQPGIPAPLSGAGSRRPDHRVGYGVLFEATYLPRMWPLISGRPTRMVLPPVPHGEAEKAVGSVQGPQKGWGCERAWQHG